MHVADIAALRAKNEALDEEVYLLRQIIKAKEYNEGKLRAKNEEVNDA